MHSPGQRDGRLQSNRVLLCIILTTFMVLLWQPRLPSPSAEAQTPYGTSQPSLQDIERTLKHIESQLSLMSSSLDLVSMRSTGRTNDSMFASSQMLGVASQVMSVASQVTIVGSQVGMLQNMLLTGLTCERTGWGWWKPTVCKWQPQP